MIRSTIGTFALCLVLDSHHVHLHFGQSCIG